MPNFDILPLSSWLTSPETTRKPAIIAGPCSAETEEQLLTTCLEIADLGVDAFRAGVWKPRTRPGMFEGNGEIAVEMHFLPTVYVKCDVCEGKRFMKETLEVKFKKKSIYDVLNMSVDEAIIFFAQEKNVADKIKPLQDIFPEAISRRKRSPFFSYSIFVKDLLYVPNEEGSESLSFFDTFCGV